MKKGFIFAGQGQQFLLMGSDLIAYDKTVEQIYTTATEILGYDVLALDASKLQMTLYTQPALYVLGYALDCLLKKQGITPECVAGLSLGEYNALTSSGVLFFEAGLKLIQKRAQIMQRAFEPYTTTMVACIKTSKEQIASLIEGTDVEICNINTPSQVVIGGTKEAIDAFMPVLKDANVRALPLKVSTVSHMSLLNEASMDLKDVLESVPFSQPQCVFVNNIEGVLQKDDFVRTLSDHISHPTQMVKVIETMHRSGVEHFIEVGPKGTISKFVREILGESVKISNVYDVETLRSVVK